jgi:peptidoglycan hydrolase-like protein with peptidoglycan-binding domain
MMTRSPSHHTRNAGSRGRTLFVSAVGVIVGAGIIAGTILGLGGRRSTTPSPPAAPVAQHVTPAPPSTPQPAMSSATVTTLQRELGRLGYYEGPITGTMNPQTVDAVKSVQRDAHLPQTGVVDSATEAALGDLLAEGHHP